MQISPSLISSSTSLQNPSVRNSLFDIIVLRPNAKAIGPLGQVSQHTKSNGNFSNNYQFVNDITPDDDTNYLHLTTLGDGNNTIARDAYSFEDLPQLNLKRINRVTLVLRTKMQVTNGFQYILFHLRYADYIQVSDPLFPVIGSYGLLSCDVDLDPITGLAFSKVTGDGAIAFNTYDWGFESNLTDDGLGVPCQIRHTQMYLLVNVDRAIQIIPSTISSSSNLNAPNLTIKRPSKITPATILSQTSVPSVRFAQ